MNRQLTILFAALVMSLSQGTLDASPRLSKEKRGCIVTLAAIAILGPAAWFGGTQIAQKWIVPKVAAPAIPSRDIQIQEKFKESNISLPQTPISIRFLPQSHSSSLVKVLGSDLEELIPEKTISSQIKIADFISRNRESLVFDEGLTQNWTAQLRDGVLHSPEPEKVLEREGLRSTFLDDLKMARALFPNGWPSDTSSLSEAQKRFVARVDAVKALYFIGVIDNLYSASSLELQNEMIRLQEAYQKEMEELSWTEFSKKHPDVMKTFLEARELEALARISIQVQANQNSQVILVYGSGHPFESYTGRYFKIEVKDP